MPQDELAGTGLYGRPTAMYRASRVYRHFSIPVAYGPTDEGRDPRGEGAAAIAIYGLDID